MGHGRFNQANTRLFGHSVIHTYTVTLDTSTHSHSYSDSRTHAYCAAATKTLLTQTPHAQIPLLRSNRSFALLRSVSPFNLLFLTSSSALWTLRPALPNSDINAIRK